MITSSEITTKLHALGSEAQSSILCRFFKTGEGQYGAGDKFLGIKVPQVRDVVKQVRFKVSLDEIEKLLESPFHEIRLCGFLLIVEEMNAAIPKRNNDTPEKAQRRDEVVKFYLRNAHRANNWDLVDLSCYNVVGQWLLHPQADGTMPSRDILDNLAASDNLWEQRIAIVSTMVLIRNKQYDDTLRIATKLLPHRHDLIHKAIGWLLREIGKRDMAILETYLESHYREMPRTALRYAIERMSDDKRQYWLKRQ